MNIKFMQSGGGMSPFTYYQSSRINTAQPKTVSDNTTKTNNDDELNDKDLMKILQDLDGLPSDKDLIFKQLKRFYQDQSSGLSTTSLATTYLSTLNQIKTAKFNKEQYDKAYKISEKNESLNEMAITESGHVLVKNENNELKALTPDEYLKNKDSGKFIPITNSQLLQERAYRSAHANGVFNTVNNSVSLPMVDKLITQYLATLGTDEGKTSGYFKVTGKGVEEGLQYLQEAISRAEKVGSLAANGISIEGLYKGEFLTKSQAKQAQHALSYIYKMLPNNAKTLLKVKAGSDKGAFDLIANLVYSTTSDVDHFNYDLIEDAEGKKPGSSSGSDSKGKTPMSAPMAALLGKGAKEFIEFNTGNSNSVYLKGIMGTMGREGENGGVLPAGSSLQEVSASNYKGILNMNDATFGGTKLNSLGLQHTAIKDSDIAFVDFPLDLHAPNGIIRPDLQLTSKMEQADDEIRRLKVSDDDYAKINEIYEKHELKPKYLPTGELNERIYKRFAIIYASVDGRALADKEMFDKNLVDIVNDDYTKESFQTLIRKKTNDKSYTMSNSWIGSDDLYQGAVFIPVRGDMFNAAMSSGTSSQFKLPTDSVREVDNRQQITEIQNETAQRYNRAPSLSTLE